MNRAALVLLAALAPALATELPPFYKEVDRAIWVVRDLDETLAAWKKSGVVSVYAQDDGATERTASGWFGNLRAVWLQPRSTSSPYAVFLEKHGPGVFALLHRTAEPDAEIQRMRSCGVAVLAKTSLAGAPVVLFDTEKFGKAVVGIVTPPADEPAPPANANKIVQFAFVIRDHFMVSRFWEKLGWPEMTVSQSKSTDMTYHGEPASYGAALGWQRHGTVPYEWIIPSQAPSVWHDHLAKHGEGFHHFAFQVEDMDRAVEQWRGFGFPFAQGGGWGQAGQKGSGRFAYMDADSAGGVQIELLWNYR